MKWKSINPIPINWYLHQTANQYVNTLGDLLSKQVYGSTWGIKHPHLCRLLPFYEHVIKEMGDFKIHNIHISRNPWVSARSQMEKNGLSQSHSLLLWCIYVIEAERNTRTLPRSWVLYDDLLDNSVEIFDKIQKDLSIKLYNFQVANETIKLDMNKSKFLPKVNISENLSSLVDDIWSCLRRHNFNVETWDEFGYRSDQMVQLILDVGKTL